LENMMFNTVKQTVQPED
jgi:hypothetical protein